MTEHEDPRQKSRRDLFLILLILPLGVLCMFMTGQVAIKLAPSWILNADMRSILDPNAEFAAGGNQLSIQPLDPGILTLPAWGDLFLTPNVIIPTRVLPTATLVPPARTPQPPPLPQDTPIVIPTATSGPIIVPTHSGPVLGDLSIKVSDSSASYTPGTVINYTITISNLGPDDAIDFNVLDTVPAVIGGLSVTCKPALLCGTNTSSGNVISFEELSLPYNGGDQIIISISGTVASGATGNLVNTAAIDIPINGRYRDPILTNNTATDTDVQRSVFDLTITKSDGADTYTATGPIFYSVVVTNNGPSDATGITVRDNIPAQIKNWAWICRSVVNASGCNGTVFSTSDFIDTNVNIIPTGRIEYIVMAYPVGLPDVISNTARVMGPGGPTYDDPNPSNNAATDVDIPYIDVQVTKDDGGAFYEAGGTVTYTVTVTNNSTFNLTGITVSDSKPGRISTWDWCAGPPCPPNFIDTDFTDTIDLSAGSSLTYTVTANMFASRLPRIISNTATVNVPTGLVDVVPANNSATDTTPPYIDLQIAMTDGVDTYTPSGSLTYTLTVTNNSTFDLEGVSVADNMPAMIASWTWTCAPAPGFPDASCSSGPNTGNIADATVNLPAGASVIYTVDAIVADTAVDPLVNTASVSPPGGFPEAVPGDNMATDTNTLAVVPAAGLSGKSATETPPSQAATTEPTGSP